MEVKYRCVLVQSELEEKLGKEFKRPGNISKANLVEVRDDTENLKKVSVKNVDIDLKVEEHLKKISDNCRS